MSLLIWLIRPGLIPSLRPLPYIAALILAFAAFFSFSYAGYKKVSLAPNSPPFLLARVLADGPGKAYLQATCGQKTYALCPYLDRLPPTASGFLWRFLPQTTDTEGAGFRKAIADEQASIIIGSVKMFPGWMVHNMLINTVHQLVRFESQIYFTEGDKAGFSQEFPFAAAPYAGSMQSKGLLSDAALKNMNLYHGVVAIVSLILCGLLMVRCWKAREFRPVMLAVFLALSFLANAFASGALGGVFGRYEGRGIWLIPFCAILMGLALKKKSSPSKISI
ncbi:MAG: hypothetical protein SFW62_07065 [Alphaproteobacteria bacterium]|nr:hypothetical protein [Alphaproteobacteria bacterium]